MPATILGKRTRGATDSDNLSTRSKRRVVLNEPNDENQNPFVRDVLGVHVDDENLSDVNKQARATINTAATRLVPAKHGEPERCISVSPSKISSHFKVRKSDVQVFEDGKSAHVSTPKTPRHRDAVSKKVPITPRHRALLHTSQTTPRSPKTRSNAGVSIYHQARQLFSRCSDPGRLVKRDEERANLGTFITTRLESRLGGCMYISGPPGTGKSALVQEALQQYEDGSDSKTSVVNCMSLRNAKDLSEKLSEDLGLEGDTKIEDLRRCFTHGKAKDRQTYLVILDEVDRLVDLDLELFYKLFEWALQKSSRLILIGIANALDLTDRCLPRLKNQGLKPELLPFMPYSAAQIAEILTAKLHSLSSDEPAHLPFFQPSALQFCAKKVASQTGDLRKAFDICRRAIDLIEQETCDRDATSPSKTPLMENINLSSPPATGRLTNNNTPRYTLQSAPKATIAHMAKVTAQVFGNGTIQRLGSLNLQQKAVLCALAALEKQRRDTQIERTVLATPSKKNSSAPSIKHLFGAYSQLCKRENLLHPLTAVEFKDVVSGLETLCLISGVDGSSGSFAVPITPSRTPSRSSKFAFSTAAVNDEKRVASVVGQKELSGALEGPGGDVLREILHGDVMT